MTSSRRLDLFCHVIDNFGDAGVCWRLVRQLKNEYGFRITFWISHLPSMQKICSSADPGKEIQEIDGITVRNWHTHADAISESSPSSSIDIPDVVIEGFGCRLPTDYIAAMAQKTTPPVWINLEYLSAENWIEEYHQITSPQSSNSLTKHFFFPGFSPQTGGLLREKNLLKDRADFQKNKGNANNLFKKLNLNTSATNYKISLFCYNDAPVKAFFDSLKKSKNHPIFCIVPEGVASNAVSDFLQQNAIGGAKATQDSLTVQVMPMIDQNDFDRLLWSCDLNFVRGEDSFLRAQWAAKPFVWQIYPQEENAHKNKLDAFLQIYLANLTPEIASIVKHFWYAWNGFDSGGFITEQSWGEFNSILPELNKKSELWVKNLASHADLASNLVRLICNLS